MLKSTSLPKAAPDCLQAALLAIAALTLWRLGMLAAMRTELWTDESQYWLWGQSLSFGAYSKPPLIGWLIRSTTEVAGDTPFGVRLAAPVLHGVTAMLVMALAARLTNARVAALAGLTYATMPAATLGAMMMTTDTPLLCAIAAALLMQHRLAARASTGDAVLLGLALGLGFLSKHAMLFAMAGMAMAALVSPAWRITRRDATIAGAVALLLALPNLLWIASHGFVTLHHLAEDGAAQGFGLHLSGAVRFLAEQLAVMGPLAFPAFLLGLRAPRPPLRGAVTVALVILGIVTLQALTSRALANWGVGFTVTGSIIAARWLARHRAVALASLALGAAVAIALPLIATFGTSWRIGDGPLILSRYLGRAEVSRRAMDFATRNGAAVIVASDRGLLADLSWQSHGSGLEIAATPHDGPPRHHWDLALPLTAAPGTPVVLLMQGAEPPACATGPSDHWIAGPGFAEGRQMSLVLTTPECLTEAKDD